MPGNGRQEAKNIQPYLEILVDELIALSNATVFDAYQQTDFKLKVEIFLHILDYPGIGKVFNVTGSGTYKGCAWCDIRGMFMSVFHVHYVTNLCMIFMKEYTASHYLK